MAPFLMFHAIFTSYGNTTDFFAQNKIINLDIVFDMII